MQKIDLSILEDLPRLKSKKEENQQILSANAECD